MALEGGLASPGVAPAVDARVAAIFRSIDRDYIAHVAADGGIGEVHERVLSEVRRRLGLC